MIRSLRLLTTWSAMAVALAVLLVSSSDTAEAHFFDPCSVIGIDNTAAGANSNISGSFGIGIGADCIGRTADDDNNMYNFGAVINFTPPEWGVAADADIPDGEQVAVLDAEATLGLLNVPCKDKVFPNFEMMDGTTNSDNHVSPLPPGTPDRLTPLVEVGGQGIIVGAEKFPHFLGPISPSNPDALFRAETLSHLRARLFGSTLVAGIQVILNFMIFEPGTTMGEDLDFVTDPALGYPSVTVLNDPTATASNEDPITDFCAPLATVTIIQGEVGGQAVRTNPSDGAYNFMTFTASQYDADEDGIENGLDPCPYDRDDQYGPNNDIAWDPRGDKNQDPGDRDFEPDFGVPFSDGIPDSCDPDPDIPSVKTSGIGIARTDEDGDLWANRVDNCPLVANVDQDDDDSDGIGNACDRDPNNEDGHQHIFCRFTTVNIGAGGTAPFTEADLICTKNAVGIDKNGDGVFDSSGTGDTGTGDTGTGDTGAGDTGTGDTGGGATQTPTPAPDVTEEEEVAAGGTFTTDDEGDGATPDNLVETTVTSPNAGTISVTSTGTITQTPPQGFEFLGRQLIITAPDATPDDPLKIEFQIDSSIIPAGADENTIQMFKDSVQVAACSDASGTASPDPCVSDRTLLSDGDVKITVLTSTASVWNFGVTKAVAAGATTSGSSGSSGAAGAAGTGVGSLAPVVSSIPAWAAIASGLGGAGLLGSLGAMASRILRRRRQ